MRFPFIIILVMSLITACCSPKKTGSNYSKEKNYSKDSLLVGLERNHCFGKCPEFKAIIYKSGYAEYNGRKNVQYLGQHSGRISPDQLSELYSKIRSYKMESMDTAYINPDIADFPTWSIWISDFKPRKHILIKDDLPAAGINQFGNELDTLFNHIIWTRDPNQNDRY
jgi:hypothetical protein